MSSAEAVVGQNAMPPVPTRIATVWLLALSLMGCVGHQSTVSEMRTDETGQGSVHERPTVSEQSKPLRESDSPYRTVVPGDTLYSIAWEAGRDYREIAAWNHIPTPYTIKPGQQLRVLPPTKPEKSAAIAVPPQSAKRNDAVAARTGDKSSSASKPAKLPIPATRAVPLPAKPGHTAGGAKSGSRVPSGKSKKNSRVAVAHAKSRSTTSEPEKTGRITHGFWAWPADGKVLGRYSEGDSKGLDIAGTRGQPVRAAASGRVVYRGSGLRGYGQLIIIKHNDEFLSAYAHNDRIYVKEGDVVKRGQKIADMGSSGSDRVKLHFEIRRQGVPIDPLKYLPKR